MAETYRCRHCNRDVPVDEGADDAIERAIGPICDECAQWWSEAGISYGQGHSGRGWYIWCAEYPDEGSVGAFASLEEALEFGREHNMVVDPDALAPSGGTP